MTPEDLWERYVESTAEEPMDLESFCRKAVEGEFGEAVTPEVMAAFLRRVESMMLANIEAKLEEAPHFQGMRDEAVERTHETITRLIERYGRG